MNLDKLHTLQVQGKACIALVRKLTERECFRLMGVDDAQIDTILHSGISRSACYKLAGNSIVVDVLYHLLRKLLIVGERGAERDEDLASLYACPSDDVDPQHIRWTADHPLKVVTLCSGYDSQCLALSRLQHDYPDFRYELTAWSEFDPEAPPSQTIDSQPAVIAHKALFPESADRNLGDMTKIDWSTLVGKCDLLFYSTPCQSISQAGLQHGFTEGSGTRSSIIWHVRDALLTIRPQYAILENVSAMVSKKFLPMFNLWRQTVEDIGYSNHARLINAKHMGVPQNRNRIFLVSLLGTYRDYFFPAHRPLNNLLRDLLEDCVDPRYYLNPVKVQQFVADNEERIVEYANQDDQPIEQLPDELLAWLLQFPDEPDPETEAAPLAECDDDGCSSDISGDIDDADIDPSFL